MKIQEIAYHRNGVSGEGFHVVRFLWRDDGERYDREMVAVVFDTLGRIAVLDVNETHLGNIAFAKGNSWRGDNFEPELRDAIAKDDKRVALEIVS